MFNNVIIKKIGKCSHHSGRAMKEGTNSGVCWCGWKAKDDTQEGKGREVCENAGEKEPANRDILS